MNRGDLFKPVLFDKAELLVGLVLANPVSGDDNVAQLAHDTYTSWPGARNGIPLVGEFVFGNTIAAMSPIRGNGNGSLARKAA